MKNLVITCSLLLALPSMLIVSGCDPAADEESPVESLQTQPSSQASFALPYGTPDAQKSQNIHHWDKLSGKAAKEARRKSTKLMIAQANAWGEISQKIRSNEVSLEEKHRLAQRLLKKHAGEEMLPMLEQTIGMAMLRGVFEGEKASDARFSEDDLEALGFATDLLIENNNPNVDLVAASLETLQGYWTEEQIRASVSEALPDARTWLAGKGCANCGKGTNEAFEKSVQQSMSKREVAISDAVSKLERLAK